MDTRHFTPLLCLWLAACGDARDELEHRIDSAAPLALEEKLVFVDEQGNRAFLLDVSGELTPQAQIVPLPHRPRWAFRRNGADEALILSVGRRAGAGQAAQPAALSLLTADGEVTRYELGANPFDSLRQSSDGRFVLLFKTGAAERLLDNRSEIAIIDLEESPGDDAISLRHLVFSDAPKDVLFSPPMRIAEEDRRLALVLSDSQVTLIDLEHLDRLETTAGLSAEGRQIDPTQIAFDAREPVIYVRAESSDDIFVLQLNPRSANEGEDAQDRNDFRPVINQVGAGQRPTDILPYSVGEESRLLVVAGSQAVVVEGEANRITPVALEQPAQQGLVFEAESPRDAEVEQRALLYAPGSSALTFVDLEQIGERGRRSTEMLSLDQNLTRVIPMLDERLALVLHDSNAVTLLDLEERTLSPISASVPLNDALFDEARKRLWVAPQNQPFVGLLDVQTGDTDEMLLDRDLISLVPMFGIGRLVATHRSSVGHITVLDADRPDREHAQSVKGFFVADLLERGE